MNFTNDELKHNPELFYNLKSNNFSINVIKTGSSVKRRKKNFIRFIYCRSDLVIEYINLLFKNKILNIYD